MHYGTRLWPLVKSHTLITSLRDALAITQDTLLVLVR
jgi:hypothetical protein